MKKVQKKINSKSNLSYLNKKRRRKRKKSFNIDGNKAAHDKFSHDNIKRKVKTHFHIFIITLLNMYSKGII